MATELRDGVWWIDCTGVNAYLVADGDGLTLVDCGTPFDASRIAAGIDQAGFALDEVERVLVTHYDVDHVGSAAKLALEIPVSVGRADADYLTGDDRPKPTNRKGLTQFVTGPFIGDVAHERVRRVEDGDAIGGFVAHHAPGHTPGHTVYVHEDREAAFLGDAVVERNGDLRPSPWILSDDVETVRRSIRDVAARTPDFEVAAMGHGRPFETGGSDRLRELAATL